MKKIAVYGAGGFGREVAWLAETCLEEKIACFVDDDAGIWGQRQNGIPIVGLQTICHKSNALNMIVAVGRPQTRKLMTEKAQELGFEMATLIHPRTEMSRWIDVGFGTVICAGCILTVNIEIHQNVQINLGCTIGHDVVMGDFTTLAPGVHVSGWVHFGKRVYVGTGAVIINGTEDNPLIIGDDAIIGAGACVTKSIPAGEMWAGVPAMIKKKYA